MNVLTMAYQSKHWRSRWGSESWGLRPSTVVLWRSWGAKIDISPVLIENIRGTDFSQKPNRYQIVRWVCFKRSLTISSADACPWHPQSLPKVSMTDEILISKSAVKFTAACKSVWDETTVCRQDWTGWIKAWYLEQMLPKSVVRGWSETRRESWLKFSRIGLSSVEMISFKYSGLKRTAHVG